MGLVPGLPKIPFFLVGGALLFIASRLKPLINPEDAPLAVDAATALPQTRTARRACAPSSWSTRWNSSSPPT